MVNRAERRALERQMRAKGGVDLKAPADRPKPPVVMFGYCWNERQGVSGFWHQSIVHMLGGLAHKYQFRPMGVESGPMIARARNVILDRFLATEDDVLLMMDTDMVFTPGDVELLLDSGHSIAGALYYNAATGLEPWSTALVEGDDGAIPLVLPELPLPPVPELDPSETELSPEAQEKFSAEMAVWRTQFEGPEYAPRKVVGVGMGLTVIRRAVAVDVKSIYGNPFEFENDKGEDLVFCLRAAEMGHETFVVPKARVGHVKTTVL